MFTGLPVGVKEEEDDSNIIKVITFEESNGLLRCF